MTITCDILGINIFKVHSRLPGFVICPDSLAQCHSPKPRNISSRSSSCVFSSPKTNTNVSRQFSRPTPHDPYILISPRPQTLTSGLAPRQKALPASGKFFLAPEMRVFLQRSGKRCECLRGRTLLQPLSTSFLSASSKTIGNPPNPSRTKLTVVVAGRLWRIYGTSTRFKRR